MQSLHLKRAWRANEAEAAANRRLLREKQVLCFELAGAPGSGRTTLLAATLRNLYGQVRAGVMLANMGSSADAEHLAEYCQQLLKLDAPQLTAAEVRQGLAQLDLDRLEWLLIEGTGSTVHPIDSDAGQNLTVAVFNVAGGDDKPAASPQLVRQADAVVLTQIDLLAHVPFNASAFETHVRRLNERVPVFGVSALHGIGMAGWLDWLKHYRLLKGKPYIHPADADEPQKLGEWHLG